MMCVNWVCYNGHISARCDLKYSCQIIYDHGDCLLTPNRVGMKSTNRSGLRYRTNESKSRDHRLDLVSWVMHIYDNMRSYWVRSLSILESAEYNVLVIRGGVFRA